MALYQVHAAYWRPDRHGGSVGHAGRVDRRGQGAPELQRHRQGYSLRQTNKSRQAAPPSRVSGSRRSSPNPGDHTALASVPQWLGRAGGAAGGVWTAARPTTARALADLLAEHVVDGVRAGNARP